MPKTTVKAQGKGIEEKKSTAIRLWSVFLIGLLSVFGYVLAVEANFLFLFGTSPGLDKLENPVSDQASEIYTADGQLIGKYFKENRSPVGFDKISPVLLQALVATEDVRFYEHSGIDPVALASILGSAAKGEKRGGSTLSQQLAKNLYKTRTESSRGLLGYLPVLSTVIAKTKEWITAVKLEQNYTKEEILTMYLNTVDFGSNSFGIQTASKTFFNTSPDSLKTEEAALLVGLLKAPTSYSPVLNPERSKDRRNVVLSQMAKYDMLSQRQADSLAALPVTLTYKVENHYEGPATYFRGTMNGYLKEWCQKNGYDLYRDGLKIYTTIDSRLQAHAEAAVQQRMRNLQRKFDQHWEGKNPWVDHRDKEIPGFIEMVAQRTPRYQQLKKKYGSDQAAIDREMNTPRKMRVFSWNGEKDTTLSPMDSIRYYKRFLHAGFMAMDPYNGQVKAWVGGINFKYFKYDHVKQSRRQPGSTFKPFVYATALENGYSPCDRLVDERITFNYIEDGKPMSWTPHNADWEYTGQNMTLRRALGKSVNTVTAKLTELVGPENVAKVAKQMGIKSDLKPVPSIGLGSNDVSVYELVGAYSTIMNNGFHTEPMFVLRIEDRNGKVLENFTPRQHRAITEETAALMIHMLKGGIEETGGTSQALWEYDLWRSRNPVTNKVVHNELACKTGTSSNHSDGWFVGMSRDLVAGAWVGGDDRSIHFRTSALGEGSKTALPVYGLFMERVYADPALDIKMGILPRPPRKLLKRYDCPVWRPAILPDSLSGTDSLLPSISPEIPPELRENL